ncbi:tail fiber domain-containing protein [Marivirga harenae]|uniref:tail fiber domain-containing protein n=1 Tax=Marivirga harenae TaxID=2010992 RepID=UPI0026E0C404|nr:tail fiber domain-containing protein [Marivirga harenae]WKV12206.1 tail fiber domain-containing protein [Marivirga harenae]
MKKINITIALILLFSISLVAQKLPFQGYLEESGVPVEGNRDFQFDLADFGWTESFSAIPVTKGIYNVVLGTNSPLPSNIFNGIAETPLTITVDGTEIGIITLYKPLISTNSLLNDEGNLKIIGINDSVNITIGSTNDQFFGNIGIFDSLGVSNGFLRARNNGGYLQLQKLDPSGNFSSAITASTSNATSSLNLFGQNTAADNASLMINNYITGNEIENGPAMSGNYKRAGTDWSDNEGTLLAAIGNARDESGPDPSGKSGYLTLWGTNSINVSLTGKRWDNNNLPILELFGNNDDGDTFFQSNFSAEILRGEGTSSYADLKMKRTDNGGLNYEGVLVTSDYGAAGLGGGIEIRNSSGINTVVLNGQNGELTATAYNNPSDRRLKKEISPLENALQNTLQLRATTYYWKDKNKSTQRQIGVIAQELEKVYPEFVHTSSEGLKSVNYAQMTAVLIEAVKELNTKIEKLRTENDNLATALNQQKDLTERISKLEKMLMENISITSND